MSFDIFVDASYFDSSTYPHLGFNPAPGVPADVEALEGVLNKCTSSMEEAGKLLGEMRNVDSGVWVGDAADAFRQHFNNDLVTDLQHAQQSLTEANTAIQNWYKDLVGFKQTAQSLDQEAEAARQALQQAQQQVQQAGSNPNLNLVNELFTNPQALQQAQSALDQAESALNDARGAEQQAQDELNSILQRAKQLEQEVDNAARNYASQLDNATKGLAPHKPGFFSSLGHAFSSALSAVGGWIEKHANVIHSICSTISAIAGVVALCTPPPIDAIAAGVGLVAGLGSVAMDLANPKTRDALGGLFTGHFTAANFKAAAGVGMDVLGAVPGIGALKSASTGAKIAEDAAETIPSLASKIPGLAKLGENAAGDFSKAAEDGSNLVKAFSNSAHGTTLVSGAIGFVNKVGTIGRDAESVINVSAGTVRNITLGIKSGSLVHDLYGDVKAAF